MLGADIDYLTLHARSRPSRVGQKVFFSLKNFGRLLIFLLQVRAVDENMAANFHQYGLASRSHQQINNTTNINNCILPPSYFLISSKTLGTLEL